MHKAYSLAVENILLPFFLENLHLVRAELPKAKELRLKSTVLG